MEATHSSSSAAASQRRRVARQLEKRRQQREARELQEQWEQQQRRAWECYSSAARLKGTRPHSAGPRTKYRGLHQAVGRGKGHRGLRHKRQENKEDAPLPRTIVERGAFTGFHHQTGGRAAGGRGTGGDDALHYRVCLPQEYQAKNFVHFSRRPRKEYGRLRLQRSRRNSFFNRNRPLSPTPSALTRQSNPNANLKVNFGALMQDMLDHDVHTNNNDDIIYCDTPHDDDGRGAKGEDSDDDDGGHEEEKEDDRDDESRDARGKKNAASLYVGTEQPYYMAQSPSRSVLELRPVGSRSPTGSRPSSPPSRRMSSNELCHIRPLAEEMRRRSIAVEHVIDGHMGTRKRRPLSASASRRVTGPAEALRGSPRFWAPQHHHPQILGNMNIPTSKGSRRISRVLRHVPTHKTSKKKRAREIARGVVMRHPVLSPVSTRSGPHLPVRW